MVNKHARNGVIGEVSWDAPTRPDHIEAVDAQYLAELSMKAMQAQAAVEAFTQYLARRYSLQNAQIGLDGSIVYQDMPTPRTETVGAE